MSDAVLKVESLKVHFPVKGGLFTKKQVVKAVDGVSFEIYPKETFGLVGESGCGKSTTGRAIVKLYEPTSGSIYYHGEDVTKIRGSHLAEFRRNVQMIFQDRSSSCGSATPVRTMPPPPAMDMEAGATADRISSW